MLRTYMRRPRSQALWANVVLYAVGLGMVALVVVPR